MGNYFPFFKEDNKQNKKTDKEKEESKKPSEKPLITLSKRYPIEENNPIFMSNNLYLSKTAILGHKRLRLDNSDIQNKNIEKKKKIKIEKKEEKDEKELIEKDKTKNNLELKEVPSIKLEIVEHKKMKIETLETQQNFREAYSNLSSIQNKMNEIDNQTNFSLNKIDNNKKSIKEKFFEKLESNKYNSFMLLADDKNNKKEEENNNIKDEINKEEENYSFQCLDINLYVQGKEGTEQLSIDITLENNGSTDWPKDNIFLRNDKNLSEISAEDIQIVSLKSGMVTKERIVFKYLQNILPGKYNSYINLNINGKNYGNPIIITVEILEDEEERKINNLIKKMRESFQLPDNEMDNESLKKALINNNYDISKAFESLFSEN